MSFTVRPVIVLVVDGAGRPAALWSNIGRRPTSAQLAGMRVRRDSVHGTDLRLTPALRLAARGPSAAADWSVRGRVWG